MHIVGRQESEPRVAMLKIVPIEEVLAECTGVLERAESRREIWAILQGLEVGLGERIAIRDVRTGVRLRDTEVRESERQAFRLHRRATVCVHRELTGTDTLSLIHI